MVGAIKIPIQINDLLITPTIEGNTILSGAVSLHGRLVQRLVISVLRTITDVTIGYCLLYLTHILGGLGGTDSPDVVWMNPNIS